jgi:hypothetical protein
MKVRWIRFIYNVTMSFVDTTYPSRKMYAFVSTAMETRSKSHRRLIGDDCFEW